MNAAHDDRRSTNNPQPPGKVRLLTPLCGTACAPDVDDKDGELDDSTTLRLFIDTTARKPPSSSLTSTSSPSLCCHCSCQRLRNIFLIPSSFKPSPLSSNTFLSPSQCSTTLLAVHTKILWYLSRYRPPLRNVHAPPLSRFSTTRQPLPMTSPTCRPSQNRPSRRPHHPAMTTWRIQLTMRL